MTLQQSCLPLQVQKGEKGQHDGQQHSLRVSDPYENVCRAYG